MRLQYAAIKYPHTRYLQSQLSPSKLLKGAAVGVTRQEVQRAPKPVQAQSVSQAKQHCANKVTYFPMSV